ncbi:hypothetical protein FEV48_10905 [Pectobacterium carotovorum subsp. carotovorum]|nr:hypothetical protein FEV48_10905 [Pectobacterium carotovorum subsp. carotovorum]
MNCAATRCLRRSYPLFGPSATRSLRGADFRGVHAAHPAATPASAQFFTPTVANTAKHSDVLTFFLVINALQ